MSFVDWVKTHKLTAFLIVIVLYFVYHGNVGVPTPFTSSKRSVSNYSNSSGGVSSLGAVGAPSLSMPDIGIAPTDEGIASETTDRVVIQNSSLSLLVSDVRGVGDKILEYTKGVGGFMVSVSYNRPSESPFATVEVRIPSEKLDDALAHFRSLGLKVTSENLMGRDVTAQYQDLDARFKTLETTKTKFEGILTQATEVAEILQVQRELVSLQQQIDSVTGQKKAIAENADFTKVTIYLSTDELALPYASDEAFRPAVIFKTAVRSLISTIRGVAGALIWVGVFSVIWVPVLIGYTMFKRWRKKKQVILSTK